MDDYTAGRFDIELKGTPGRHEYTLYCTLNLEQKQITNLVSNGEAEVGVVVECKQNLFRQKYRASLSSAGFEITIPADSLVGSVQVLALVVAGKELTEFTPDNLNEDYKGIPLVIPKNSILAFTETKEFEASQRADQLKNVSSIMRVKPAKKKGDFIDIQKGGDRIIVEISEKNYRIYRRIIKSGGSIHVISSILVAPVILEVLHNINQITPEDRANYEDRLWYRVIRRQLQKHSIDVENSNIDPLECCNKILESPFGRALRELDEILDAS